MTAGSASAKAKSGRSPLNLWLRTNALQVGITLVAVLMWSVFAIGSPETFFRGNIYQAFMSTTPFFGIMALSLTLVVITGEIDLSFPSIMTISMWVFATVMMATGNLAIALVLMLLMGTAAGMINGLIITKIGVPSLVVTIGTSFFWRGMVKVLTGGTGTSLLPTRETTFYDVFVGRLFGFVPMQMVWMIVFGILCWLILNRHRFGAHVYLTGDNPDSARLMGVNVDRTKIIVFGMAGFAAAFASLLASLEVTYYWPTLGEGYLLNTLSSVFLGGTSVFGGTGTIYGTFVASFIIGAINAGIVAIGMSGFWTELIYGLIIVLSVVIQTIVGRRIR